MGNTRALRHTLYAVLIAIVAVCIILACVLFGAPALVTHALTEEHIAAFGEPDSGDTSTDEGRHPSGTPLTASSFKSGGTYYEGELGTDSYYLTEDIVLHNNIKINGDVNLCLNGHMITGTGTNTVITVKANHKLTLFDCMEGDKGHAHYYTVGDNGVYEFGSGTNLIYGGVITGGNSHAGGGVNVEDGAGFVMYGGTIAGNTVTRDTGNAGDYPGRGGGVYAGGTFTMNGGAISYNTAAIGGGVSVRNNAVFTMKGGEISHNSAGYAEGGSGNIDAQESSIGGGVNVGDGSFIMEGGTIAFNSAISSASNTSRGGGVYVYTDSSFTMSGGEIYGNTASENGGGVYVYGGGSFTMSGGKIGGSEEHANKAASGAGVAISGQFSMTGGEISYNAATNQGGGVYVTLGTAASTGREVTNGLFTMSGGTISHNSANVGGGVYIWTGATFTMIAGDNGNGGTISNNSANEYGGGVYAYDFSMSAGTISNNKVESTTSLTAKGGGVYAATSFEMTGGTISGNEAEEGGGVYAGYTATMSGGEISGNSATRGGGIYANYNFTISENTSGGAAPVISGNEATDGAGIYIYNGTLAISAGTIGGTDSGAGNIATGNGGGVYVSTYATMTMQAAADGSAGTISGNEAANGGGIYAANSFTISGGTITSNEATNGGGVYAANGLTMSAGTISANVATNGGGVYTAGGTFTMTGGTIGGEADADGNAALMGGGIYIDGGAFSISNSASIMSNSAHDGAGVYVTDGSFTMTGGVISNNDASVASVEDDDTTARGGGVYINNGTFTMSGGKIGGDESGNRNWVTTGGYGGAVYLAGGSDASTISDTAEIAGNQATMGYGGGIYLASGTLNITGGTIGGTSSNDKNDAGLNGGGIYVAGGTLNMSGGTITGNTADNGAGIYFANGTFNMSGTALISANKGSVITGSGFGVYLASGTFTMSGGTISKNTISDHRGTSGGGVYVGGGEFKMVADESGAYGTISENVATFGGGVHVADGGKFTMSAGVISANRGQEYSNYGDNYGGGVYVNGGTFTMTGGTISGNTVLSAGGGVYVNSGTFNMSGTASIYDNEVTSWSGTGGGVGIAGGTFNMTGGSITGNSSANSGGGVGALGGEFIMSNGTISANQALMAGGVYISGGTFTMSGTAEITSHETSVYGSGIYVAGNGYGSTAGTLNLNGGSITGNKAIDMSPVSGSGGGVYAVSGATININGSPTVTGNTANSAASNVYLCSGVIINASDDTTNNISSGTNSIGITLADDYVGDEGVFAYSANSNAAAFTSDQGGTVELKDNTTYGYRIYYTATVEIYTGNTLSADGGTITGDVTTSNNATYLKVYHGEGATFTPEANTGYRYESAEFDSTKLTNYTISYKQFTDATNKTLKVTFVVSTFDVTFTNTGGATFTGSDTTTYTYGTEVQIGAPSLDGYTFLGWQVNGGENYAVNVNGYTINSATVNGLSEGVTTITLTAKWDLADPSSVSAGAISGTYSGSAFTTTASATHGASGATIGYTYSWSKQNSDFTASGATLSATNVADSGTYTVKATVSSYSGTVVIENGSNLGALSVSGDVSVTISPAQVPIPTAATNLVYNGGEQTGVADGDHYGVSGNVQTNAGSYTATATLDDKNNYVWAGTNSSENQTISWSIGKLSLNGATISLSSTSLVYNGATQTVSVTGVTVGTLNPAATDYTVTGNSGKDAAKYTLTITATDSSTNYTGTASTTWEITAKEISEIVWSNASPYTYNGSAQAPTLGSNTWLCENDNITAILQTAISGNNLTSGAAVNVGSYTITASLKDGVKNYKFAESVTNASCNFEIAAKELTAIWYVDGTQAGGYASSQTYKGSAFTVTATAATGVNSETVTVSVSAPEGGAVNASDTAYTFTASVNGNSNYVISSASEKFALTITPKQITQISWTYTNGDVAGGLEQPLTVSGGSASLTYNGSEYALAATFASEGSDGSGGNINLEITGGKFTAASTYEVSAKIPDKYSGNYVLAEGVGSISVTVSQGTASVSAATYKGETAATAFVYGDSITVKGSVANGAGGTITVKAGDVELGTAEVDENGTFEVTYATSAKSIQPNSSIALTISFGGNDNLGSATATANISLTAKQVTAQVTNTISKVYDGNADVTSLTLSVAGSDLVNSGDDITVSGTAVYDNKNAGTGKGVTVTLGTIGGTDAVFYNVSAPTNVTGEITKATITVTSFTVTDRDYVENNTSVVVTVTGTSGIIGEDSVTVLATGTMADANAGTNKAVTITYSLSGADADNYKLDPATGSGTVTINKIDPAYTAPADLTATYGDTLAKVILPTGWTWNDTSTSVGNVGSHTFAATFTPEDTTNYNAVGVDLSVEVGKAQVTISWTEPDYTYSGTDKTPAPTIASGALAGDDLGATATITSGNATDGKAINVGSYTATATLTGTAAGNYEISGSADKTFTITAMSIAAVWSVDGTQVSGASDEVTYKGAEFAVTATATDVNGTIVTLNVTAPTGGAVNASENAYEFTASISDTNYTLTNTSFDLTIGKAALTVSASVEGEVAYGTAPENVKYTVSYSGFMGTDNAGAVFGTSLPAASSGYSATTSAGTKVTITITVTEPKNCNYTITNSGGSFTVAKASLDVTQLAVTASNAVYDGNAKTATVTAGSLVGVGEITVLYSSTADSYTAAEPKNAGTYYVFVTVAEGDNYYGVTEAYTGKSFTISRATVAIPAAAEGLVYNGSEQTGIAGGDHYGVSGNVQTNAGSYTATATLDDKNNYVWAGTNSSENQTISWSIEKLSLNDATITLNSTSLVYNGETQTVSVTGVTISGLSPAAGDYTVTGNSGEDAKEYTLTITAAENSNYKDSATVKWNITAKEISAIVWSGASSYIYNGGAQAPALGTQSWLCTGDTLTDILQTAVSATSGALKDGAAVNVGSYQITASLNSGVTNYALAASVADRSFAFDITQKEITPSWSYTANGGSAVSISGSASVSYGYTYSVSAAAGTSEGVVSGESVTFSYAVSGSGNAASLTAIGSYTITASLPAGSNYKIAEDAESVTFTIVTATTGYGSISFTTLPADNKIIYGDSFTVKAEYAAGIDQNITDGAIRYTVTSGGDCAEIGETTGVLTAKAAGEVTIQATWSKDGYADLIAKATITVTVRQVTVSWSEDGADISGNAHTITYDGATHSVSAAYNNALTADIASAFVLTAKGMKDAGTYTATVSLANGWDNRYSLSGNTLTYTINKAALTVSAGVDGTVAYGTAPENVKYIVSYGGFMGTDNADAVFGTSLPAASSNYSATTSAGTEVTITITVTEPANCNYTITNSGGSFTVAKATLDVTQLAVTANNAVYDGNAKTATVTAGSLEGVGTITVLYSSAANTYTAAEPKNAGTYYVFVTVAEGDNYYGVTEAYTGKSFTISRATVAIPEAAEGLVYNGSEQTGVAGGELYTVTGGSATNAYGYTATVSLKDSANYVWADNTDADKDIAWSIAPKIISAGDISWTYVNGDVAGGASQALTVSNGSATLTYNGSEYALAATFAGEGADGRIALDVAGGTFTNKGSYPVSAAMPTAYSGNYVLAEGAGSITADVAEGVASVSAATYSGNELTAEFVYGDVITVSGAVVNGAGGSITVMAGEVELGKTTVSADGTYEVTYNTASKGILPGEVTLNISFGGNSNLSAAQTSVDISLDKKQVTAYVSGDIAKVYDGSAAAEVTLAVAEGDLVNAGDELTVSGTAAYSDINAGLEKAVAVTLTAIGGADAAFYEVVAPANVTGDITKVTLLDGTAAVEAVYDGKAHALEIVLSGFVNGEMQTGAAGYAVEYSSDGKTWQSNPIAVTDVINSGTVYYRVSYTNYEIVEGSADITITPFVLFGEDIVWYSANEKIAEGERQLISGGLVYNGAAHVITAEIAGVGEMLELVVENDVIFAVPEGGTHSAAAALAEGVTNYVFDEASLTEILIAVSNAELIVEVQPYTGVYDGAAHAAFAGYSAVTADGTQPVWQFSLDGVQYSSEMPEFTEAGTYTVYYSVSADYHDAISGEAEVVISPASLYELSISGGYFEYNGLPHTVRVTVTDSNGNVIPSENYRVTYFGNVHAGTASVRVTGTGNYSGTLTGRFAITTRRVAAEWQLPAGALGSDGSYSAAFGGSFTLSASAELGIDGESAVITYLINGRPAESVNITEAGTYTITAVLSEVIGGIASDYTLTNSTVTVSLIDASGDGGHSPIFAYEDPENLVYDGTRKEAKVTPIGIYSGYDAIVYYSSTEDKITSAEPVDVGTYYVFASVNIGGEQAFEPVLVGEFTIVKAVVAIPEFNGKIYADGELNAVLPDGFNSDIMDIEGNTFVEGGDYTATVTLKDTHNYEWEDGTTSEKEISFHVEPLIDLLWLIILLLIILIIEIIVAIVLGRRIKRYREQLEGGAEGADGSGGAGKQNMLAAAPIGLFGINAPVWQIVAVMVLGAAVIVMAIVDIALGVKCGKLKRELEAKLQAGAEQPAEAEQPSDGGKAE